MICPKCGSNRVTSQILTETSSVGKTKGFGCIKACIGMFIAGPFGFFCGMCGMGKGKYVTTTRDRMVHLCQDCGNKF